MFMLVIKITGVEVSGHGGAEVWRPFQGFSPDRGLSQSCGPSPWMLVADFGSVDPSAHHGRQSGARF